VAEEFSSADGLGTPLAKLASLGGLDGLAGVEASVPESNGSGHDRKGAQDSASLRSISES